MQSSDDGRRASEDAAIKELLEPARLWTAAELVGRPSHVPKSAGVYAWYFNEVPPLVPTEECHRGPDGQVLLYVGIAPKETRVARSTPTTRTLRDRFRDHLAGNAEGSTLRLTLGCLLAERLSIKLRRVGSGKRYTFTNPGEIVLDGWLAEHAHIAFAAVAQPWKVEARLLSMLSLPLNLAGNAAHQFAIDLGKVRAAAKREANILPIVEDSGGARRAVST